MILKKVTYITRTPNLLIYFTLTILCSFPVNAIGKPFTGALLERFEMCQKLTLEECLANDSCLTIDSNDIPVKSHDDKVKKNDSRGACGGSILDQVDIQQIKDECKRVNGEFKKAASYLCICTHPDSDQRYYCIEDFISQIIQTKIRAIDVE